MLWKATGGKIDAEGVFTAGPDEGRFLVTATAGGVGGTAAVEIATGAAPLEPTKPTKAKPGQLSWSGEVPPQRWMNFYTKVLSRFARDSGLKLTVGVEVSPEGGISEQSVEETKVALRELGLKDDVKTS